MIHGIIYEKIEGQRNIRPGEQITNLQGFQYNNRIVNLEIITIGGRDKPILKIEFIFTTTYTPPIALMTLKGHVLYESTTLSLNEIETVWRSKNTLPDAVAKEIIGNIIARSIQKATILSDQLNVPPPIPMPKPNDASQAQKASKRDSSTDFLA